jgi:hypothetical protein
MDKGRVQIPAVGLIVTAGLDALFALVFMFLGFLDISMIRTPWVMDELGPEAAEAFVSGGFIIIICIAGLFIDAIIAFGALKMMKLESYGFAVAAALLAVIPCLSSPCIVLGVPFGIWALFVLMDPEVRNAFMESPTPPKPAQK